MEYHIISGKVIETRRCWMTARSGTKVRGQRKAGNTSARKIAANEQEAVKRLARILNTNFSEGFLFVTLKYSKENLPPDYPSAGVVLDKFLRAARGLYRKEHEDVFRYVKVNANWSPKRKAPARLHHHVVMSPASLDMLEKLWPAGEFHVKRVSNPGDLTTLASYLIANVEGLEPGQKKWSCSKGLDKPIYTEPKPVEDVETVEPLPNTQVVEANQTTDEDGLVSGSYMRCLSRERIKVRGGQVVMPRKTSRKIIELPNDISQLGMDEDE